jgi:lipopolysaccharide exporter
LSRALEAVDQTKRLVRTLFASGGTLSQRAARGGFWAFFSYGGGRLLGVIRSIILARLLLPDDFGLMGLAEVATGFLAVMTEMGVAPTLIHKQDANGDVLHTAWIISVLRGILLCIITFLAASPTAAFFGTPALTPILQVMAFMFIASGLNNTGLILLKKELEFRTLAYFDLAVNASSLIVATIAAVILRNTWALVLGALSQALVILIGSYIIHPFRPRPKWHSGAAKDVLNFGKYIFGAGIVNYFLTQGDDALVGKILGTAQLGFYGMAYKLSNMPTTSITHVIGRVAFPAYAKLQNDIPALRQAYLRILKITSLLAVPMAGGLFALAPELVQLLYGQNWLPMIPSFMVLCAYGLERAVNASVGALFNAKGKPQIPFYLVIFKLILLALMIYPLTVRYGILGTSVASALVAVIISMNAMPLVARALECKISMVLRPLVGPFAATGMMVSSLLLLKLSGWFNPNFFSLMTLVIVGVLVYALSLYMIDRPSIQEIKQLITLQLKPTEVPVQQTSKASDCIE